MTLACHARDWGFDSPRYRMRKFLYGILLASSSLFSQGNKLLPNRNPDAKELKAYLNKDKDSILLESSYKIRRVEILKKGFTERHYTNNICIADLPKGRYTLAVSVNKKLITLTLIIPE